MRREGEVILAGEPVLAIAEASPSEIIAYANQAQIGQIQKGMEVTLIKKPTPPTKGRIDLSRIVHVGATMERKPERLWQNPNIAEWGLPILIAIPRNWELVSGELVGIRMGRS